MTRIALLALICLSVCGETTVEFATHRLTSEFFSEGANVGDFNKDGTLDVVAGPYWYAGPDFSKRHAYYQPQAFDPHGYSRHFFSFVDDFNGDGWDDVLVVGFPGQQALLYLNPQTSDELWSGTQVLQQVGNESPCYADLTGDGKAELVCMQNDRFGYAMPGDDPAKPWAFHPIHEDQKGGHAHGLGIGDVNGDGRLDILCKSGWFAQPEGEGHWPFHAANFGNGGAQMHAYDVDGDGDNDVISSIQAHGYGLAWFEQTGDGFTEHRFVGDKPERNRYGIVLSQIHALDLVDIDGDGLKDIVTGKRFWAHGPKGDAEPSAPCVLYWFRLQRSDAGVDFVPHFIDDDSGVGTQVLARDIDGDALPDVLVGCKRGLFVHRQRRREISAAEFAKRQPIPRSTPAAAPRIPLVVETEPKTPEEQRQLFNLPPGFVIQLVASERDIGQPINLNFDARGRLWVSHTLEYPFPARDSPRDRVSIFGDFDANGRPGHIEHLQPGLDIPIGLLPSLTGDSVIVHDVGRTVAYPARSVLFEGFGYKDTHGMNNSFTRGLDGWIYALHGFANGSQVRRPGDDRVLLAMTSGNSYRFGEDGSAIEQITWGQTNPFGLTIDPWGNHYSADCHSMPVYMLIRGAHYPGLGKKAPAIGHAPKMIDHNHGSTGIAGIAWYHDEHFPAGYKDTLFIGNPVNGIVHWDRLRWKGASPSVDTQADFIRCDDPWFRPVDLKMGPDGALYIADFYNCIIGHYEVKLDHEKRDRRRGRIWRVVYQGEAPQAPDLTQSEPIAALEHPNLRVQNLAVNLLVATSANAASLEPVLRGGSVAGQANALWVLARTGALKDEHEQLALAGPARVRAQLARVYALLDTPNPDRLITLLGDLNHQVRRAAAETMRSRPNPRFIEPLLRILGDIHPEDNHLAHTLRIALAAHCQSADDIAQLRELRIPKDSWPELLKVIIASEHTSGADFLLDALADKHLNAQQLQPALSYLASHTDIARIDILRPLILAHPSQDDQFAAFAALIQGLARRNIGYQAALKNWVVDLVGPVLVTPPDTPWTFSGEHNSFGLRSRNCEDGVKTEFFDSIVGGETHTGRMRSAAFAIPATLSFWMCGHNGQPGSNPPEHNHVRLVLAESGETIAQALPPRHDTARRFSWDLAEHVGKQAHFEIIDGQTFTGFAWLAVARFEPPVITVPKDLRRISRERQVQAIEWVESFGILDFSAEIEAIAADAATPGDLRVAASSYLIKHAPDKAQAPIQAIFAGAGRADQERLATMLSGSPAGAELLFTLIEEGKASARLLQMPGLAARLRDDARIASLTQDLQPLEAHLAKLLAERQKGFASATRSAEKGAVIFDTHCTACHQLGGQGARIGPGLDGIGNRGAERLLEDILDPNRNVDAAFHPAVITLKSGDVLSGLLSEEDDGILTLTDMVGKAHPIPIANIASKAVSKLSLMPPTYGELLSAQQLYDLVEFLRSR